MKQNSRFIQTLEWTRSEAWWHMPFGPFRERFAYVTRPARKYAKQNQPLRRTPTCGPRARCTRCGLRATYFYSPAGDDLRSRFCCDVCVPRGCECTADPTTGVLARDARGRLIPCCEYVYDSGGFWVVRGELLFRDDALQTNPKTRR